MNTSKQVHPVGSGNLAALLATRPMWDTVTFKPVLWSPWKQVILAPPTLREHTLRRPFLSQFPCGKNIPCAQWPARVAPKHRTVYTQQVTSTKTVTFTCHHSLWGSIVPTVYMWKQAQGDSSHWPRDFFLPQIWSIPSFWPRSHACRTITIQLLVLFFSLITLYNYKPTQTRTAVPKTSCESG